MKADPAGVLTGSHYLDGDHACAEGAMAAGCRFVAGYPITPSTEVVERISRRFPFMGGTFIQMEDEMASMAAVVGGSWTGTKSMTVTSGPGFSLMMENLGLAIMMEAPCVVVNVQRGGPSTGLTHDEKGYPVMSAACQDTSIRRLVDKIKKNADAIVRYEEEDVDGADVVLVSYGITSRVTREGMRLAKSKGAKVGHLRLVIAWPFPEKRIAELASKIKAFVVPEVNLGQMVLEVERCAAGKAAAVPVSHAGGGVHDPQDICDEIVRAAK
jgi:pyruvate/2-oxoacid:ferredoxin oxidoreductase alpha subunit